MDQLNLDNEVQDPASDPPDNNDDNTEAVDGEEDNNNENHSTSLHCCEKKHLKTKVAKH